MLTAIKNKVAPYSLFRSLFLTLIGFLLIFFGLNLYQYYRVKSDIASTLLQEINEKELGELRTFFNTIGDKLHIVRDWGRNGVLNSRDIVSLNKKFFPLLDHQEYISGVLLADSNGGEYFLYQKGTDWFTRTTRQSNDGNRFTHTKWENPESGNLVSEEQTSYDPKERPWYKNGQKSGEVYWTPLYTFFETKEKGITASVSWKATEEASDSYVFGIDIPRKSIQRLMHSSSDKQPKILFLINIKDNIIIPGVSQKDADNPEKNSEPIRHLVQQWQTSGQPIGEAVIFSYQNRKWLGSLKPLVQNNTVFWIGVTAPEEELLTNLNDTLLKVDLTDFIVATAGGIVLLFFIWKNGGFRSGKKTVDPVVRLHDLINQGEGARVEFKSTIRTNVKTGKKGKEIELAWLKAVVGFLNSDGGTLLLGVEDNGTIGGLEIDAFENSDRCLLHIKNLINQHVGAEFSGFLDIIFQLCEEKGVVMIDIHRAGQPVFLKIGKNEEFYIRSGPSSIKLSPSQMISYVLQNKMVHRKAGRA